MTIILSHDDLDGIVSAALLEQSFPGSELYFLSYLEPEQWIKTLTEVREKERTDLFILDLGINSFFGSNGILQLLQENSGKHYLTWYDHHKWDLSLSCFDLSPNSLIDSEKPSTARILIEEKGFTDPFSLLLARYADLSDHMVAALPAEPKDKDTRRKQDYIMVTKLDDLLRSDYDKKEIVRILAHEKRVWLPEFEQARKDYLRKKPEAEKLLQRQTFFYQTPFPFVVSLSPSLLFSRAARLSLEKAFPQAQLLIILFENTQSATIYSSSVDVNHFDVNQLAQSYGGCGHSYAAGFYFKERITSENFPHLKKKLLSQIRECYT